MSTTTTSMGGRSEVTKKRSVQPGVSGEWWCTTGRTTTQWLGQRGNTQGINKLAFSGCTQTCDLQVLRVCGLRSRKGLALRRRALGSLLQGVHALPHQLYIHRSVHVPGYLGVSSICVEDSALLCTCHQATLRLSTGIFTSWQTKLASLNGTTRMWATLIYKTLLNKDSNPDNNYFTPFLSSGLLPISNTQKSVRRVLWYSWERHHQKTLSKVGKTVPEDQNFVNHYFFH